MGYERNDVDLLEDGARNAGRKPLELLASRMNDALSAADGRSDEDWGVPWYAEVLEDQRRDFYRAHGYA